MKIQKLLEFNNIIVYKKQFTLILSGKTDPTTLIVLELYNNVLAKYIRVKVSDRDLKPSLNTQATR